MRAWLRPLLATVTLAAAACTPANDVVTTPLASTGAPALSRVDATSPASAVFTRPHVYFLEPITTNGTPSGQFDPTLSPSVHICALAGDACGTSIADYTADVDGNHYAVNWHVNKAGLTEGNAYRLEILVAGTRMASIDFMAVGKKKDASSVDTAHFVALPLTGTLPVKFRMEIGAVSVVNGASGGQASTDDGAATVDIPPGATTGDLGVTADPIPVDNTELNNEHVLGNAVDFGPEGTTFSAPVTITIHYDPANLPPGFAEHDLALGLLTNGLWIKVPGSSVDPGTHTVTGQTTHFSTYGVVAFGTFTQIAAGERHACGITATHDAYCWGDDANGQLGSPAVTTCTIGTGTQPCTLTPAPVTGGIQFVSISAGGLHTCGIAVSGDAYCWGQNYAGYLGTGDTTSSIAPRLVAGGLHWTSLSVGYANVCGIATTGQLYCWGDNRYGQIGATASDSCGPIASPYSCALAPNAITSPTTFTEVSVGLLNVCAVATDHTAWCWGWNAFGVVGDGTTTNRNTPTAVSGGLSFDHVSAGGLSSCGVTTTNAGYCWGANVPYRVLGIGVAANSHVPVAVSGGLTMSTIVANHSNIIFEHNCAITTSNELWCWGGNDAQQLGSTVSNETCGSSSTWACQNVPTHVAAGVNFTSVAVGAELTCAISTDGNTYCMGNDQWGQIGDGTTSNSRVWTPISPP